MCFLPPNCLFCTHYFGEKGRQGRDCLAFKEIPEEILFGGVEHTTPFPGDGGFRFELKPEFEADFFELAALRKSMGNTGFNDQEATPDMPGNR